VIAGGESFLLQCERSIPSASRCVRLGNLKNTVIRGIPAVRSPAQDGALPRSNADANRSIDRWE
jgi:hypothetical protein